MFGKGFHEITKSDFGTTNTGENINIYHLENEAGAYVEILNFGCRLVKIVVPDRNGNPTDVCLGMDTMSAYEMMTQVLVLLSDVLQTASKMVILL